MPAVDTEPARANTPALGMSPGFQKRLKDALFSISLANLCFINSAYLILYYSADAYFIKMRLNRPTLLAQFANICLFALAIWCCTRLLRRIHRRGAWFLGHCLFFLALLPVFEFLRIYVFKIADFRLVAFMLKPGSALVAVLLLALILWRHRRVAGILALLVAILSPLAFLTLGRIIFLTSTMERFAGADDESALQTKTSSLRQQGPRVVWLLFDEMDYRLVFEQPLLDLRMPEFERLRKEAIFTTGAVPPGDNTLVSIPALTTGKRLTAVAVANPSDLEITFADTAEVKLWSETPTVFSEAQALGINTALVGWYHPYARVLRRELDYCSWQPIKGIQSVGASSFGTALKRQIASLAVTPYSRLMYAKICQASIADSLSVASNRNYGLTFLHLPPPHRPGIYNPEKQKFTIIPVPKAVAYRNNLILADRTLGRIRRVLESTGQWDGTWLIISSDHSWRESRMYDARRDFRVPFFVKSAGSNGPVSYSSPFNTVCTHDLVMAILRGELTNQPSAVAWLQLQPAPGAPVIKEAPAD